MNKNELLQRTQHFAVGVFRMVEKLPAIPASKVVSYQLLKSNSSVAANYRAVNRAKSDADFCNKLKVVLEEADESNFWLMFIKDINFLPENADLDTLIKESGELNGNFCRLSKNNLGEIANQKILNLNS
jgi:four helix bundle protein